MNKDECLNLMKLWYAKSSSVYEIVFQKDIRKREFAVIAPKYLAEGQNCKGVRHMSIIGVDCFKYCLDRVLMFYTQKHVWNLYKGLVMYNSGVPKMSPILHHRGDSIDLWKKERPHQIVSCDCFIDIDSPNRFGMPIAKEDAGKIHAYLCELGMPHSLTFSGMGYHLIIPFYCFSHLDLSLDPDLAQGTYYDLFNNVCEVLSEKFSEFVDTNGLHDSMRITKLPYSLTFYPDGCYVCWSFNDEIEFEMHNYSDYKMSVHGEFKGQKSMFKRGIKVFSEDAWTSGNTDAFLHSLGIKK